MTFTTLPNLPLRRLIHDTLITFLPRPRHIIRRVKQRKVIRLQMNLRNLRRHNREVLSARVMRKPKRVPDHDILIAHNVALSGDFRKPRLDAGSA